MLDVGVYRPFLYHQHAQRITVLTIGNLTWDAVLLQRICKLTDKAIEHGQIRTCRERLDAVVSGMDTRRKDFKIDFVESGH